MSKSKEELVNLVKEELDYIQEETLTLSVGFQLLDDGTLALREWDDEGGKIIKVYILNISIGRELKPEEWQVR